jgi:hypothetical protein
MRPDGSGSFYVQSFHELVETLAYALSALGHDVSFRSNVFVPEAQNVVLGAQFADPKTDFPPNTILYNLEQIGGNDGVHLVSPEFTAKHRIWEYSPANMPYWKEHNVDAQYVPIGYVPQLTRINPALYPDIDILFYGSVSPRRLKILQELQRIPGIKVQIGMGFGKERDPLIARSKVILNCHYYESPKLFEQVRVSYLLSNRKCVVCEVSDDFPPALSDAVRIAPYDELVRACRDLVRDVDARLWFQRQGYESFAKLREVDILRPILKQLSTQ